MKANGGYLHPAKKLRRKTMTTKSPEFWQGWKIATDGNSPTTRLAPQDKPGEYRIDFLG